MNVLSPDQAVVPMSVSKVLVFVPRIWLGSVILAVAIFRIGGNQGRTLVKIERDVTFQAYRVALIRTRGEKNGSTALRRSGVDSAIYGIGIDSLAVTLGAICADVVDIDPN